MKIKPLARYLISLNYEKRTLNIMKVSVFIMFVCIFQLYASTGIAQNAEIKLASRKTTIEKLFSEIEKQTNYLVVYSNKEVAGNTNISLSKTHGKVSELLNELVTKAGLKYEYTNNYIVFSKNNLQQEKRKVVKGIVKDSSGEPIIGASIMVKGTTEGTISDTDGHFELQVINSNQPLIISYIGYETQNILLPKTSSMLDITLKESSVMLNEVVAIGYGTAKKSDLTGAVTHANMQTLESSASVNIAQGLKGVVPGLNIGATTSAGGDPDISIRGRNTISGSTSPLIVLDGIIYRGNLTDINPSDIESVDVLKDASSTAIYGSQAANGVMIITTKSAKNMSKPIIEYNTSFTFQGMINNDIKRLNAAEYVKQIADSHLSESRIGNDMLTVNPDFNPSVYFRDSRCITAYLNDNVDTDWWGLMTEKTPYIINHNLSLRGKTDLNSYFISLGYTDQKNLIVNDKYKRYNIRVNLDSRVTDWLKVGTNSYFTLSDYSGYSISFSDLFSIPALISPYEDNSNNLMTFPYNGELNPLLSVKNDDFETRQILSGCVYADITVPYIKGLSYRLNYSNTQTSYKHNLANPYANSLQGQAYKQSYTQDEWTLDNILTYKHSFGKHSINSTLVYGVEKRTYDSTGATANYFTDFSLGYNNLGQGQSDLNEVTSSAWKETSLYTMFRTVYSYDDRYILTGTVRRDGFSGFGENNKFGWFPSVAAAWRINEENFMKSIDWLDNLKLRLSYGSNGNRTAGRYSTLAQMRKNNPYNTSSTGYVFGDGGSPELLQVINTMANSNLKWETTNSLNFGLDFSVLNGRLFGNYEFYISNTHNLLYDVSIPSMNGVSSNTIAANIGKLENYGHEFSITGIPVKAKDFTWTITGNFSLNKNEVKSIIGIDANGDGKEDDLPSSSIFIGKSLSAIYDYKIIGMWQLSDYNNGSIPSGFTYGTYKIADLNNDSKYSADEDRSIVGYTDPLYRFSIQNNLKYKDFEMNIFINSIQGGNNYYKGQEVSMVTNDTYSLRSYFKFDYWTPENPNAKYRQLGAYTSSLGYTFGPYTSRSFIRLQELSFAYNIPSKLLKSININKCRIFVSGTNLLTFTKWKGWDPEAGQGMDPYQISSYPTSKTYTFGLNVEF